MTRRCSHCCNNGHNSRTCPTRGGVKLFGVRLTDGSIRKSASMGNLSSVHYNSSSSAAASPNPSSPSSDHLRDPTPVAQGYVSDDPAHASSSSNCRGERKKGTPWTEEEHRLFLKGLQRLGKGDWRGIARNFVMSRTPTQVASHAQKYFVRQNNASRRKRRSSLFDMVPDMSMDPPPVPEEQLLHASEVCETKNANILPPLHLSLKLESEPMDDSPIKPSLEDEETITPNNFTPIIPPFLPTYLPIPFPFLPPQLYPSRVEEKLEDSSQPLIFKPIPILSKDPVHIDELIGISKLTLGENGPPRIEPSPLSMKLLGSPSRQSAFQANTSIGGSSLRKRENGTIHAV